MVIVVSYLVHIETEEEMLNLNLTIKNGLIVFPSNIGDSKSADMIAVFPVFRG